jgi:UPF0755 protein
LAAVLAGGLAVRKILSYPEERRAGAGKEVIVPIERGMNFPAIAARLQKSGIIDNPRWFRLYAMHRGATTKVRVGNYVLKDDMTPKQVLDNLLAGVEEVTVSVTIPEGKNILEVFEILDAAGIAGKKQLEALARDPEYLEKQGIIGDTIEGYLFPETYRFKVPTDPAKVLETMVNQHRVVWDRVRSKYTKEIQNLRERLDWSERDILVMASIVEKEAVAEEERARIAQVFINRLTTASFSPKRLETDPTIRYGCMVPEKPSAACRQWKKTDRLRTIQLRDVDNPYNTYQREGLPPGPICSPGEKSLVATVNPDGTNYFYFVAREDKRTHVFSRTLAEHERAVDKYQR